MSGLEILGAAGSVASLMEVAGRLYSTLHTFVVNTKDADVTAQELSEKVETLQETVSSIKVTLKQRKKRVGTGKLEKEEAQVVFKIKKSVEACTGFLVRFDEALKGLQKEKKTLSWAAKARIQLKLESREVTIVRLEKNIDTHIQILQTSLACFNMVVNDSNHEEMLKCYETLLEEIRKSKNCLVELQQVNVSVAHQGLGITPQLSKGDEPESSRRAEIAEPSGSKAVENNVEYDIQEWIDAATEVETIYRSSASSAREQSERSTVKSLQPEQNRFLQITPSSPPAPRSPSLIDAIASNDHLTLNNRVDPTPDFDDSTDLEPLEELIKNFKTHVEEEQVLGKYNQAEVHQLEVIELMKERHSVYGKLFDEYYDMQSILADIYDRQEKYEKGDAIRHALLQDSDSFDAPPGSTEQKSLLASHDRSKLLKKARQYHRLAENYHLRYLKNRRVEDQALLNDAERDAKRAFKCRRQCLETPTEEDKDLQETVDLLVRIYDDQIKPIYAATYRALYLPNVPTIYLTPSLPSISPKSSYSRLGASESASESSGRKDSIVGPADLISAILADREDTVDECLRQDFIPQANRAGKTAIMAAVDRQNKKVIQKLLKHPKANDGQVDDALLYAAWKGDSKMVEYLLEHDADPKISNMDGHTPLHIAAMKGNDTVVSVLLNHRADPNAHGPDALTPLHYAVHENKKSVVLTLLNHPQGANINAANEHNQTPLHYAALSRNIPLAEVLLDRQANTELQNSGGKTALETAVAARDIDFVDMWLTRNLPFDLTRLPEKTNPDIKNLFLRKLAERGDVPKWPKQDKPPAKMRERQGSTTSQSTVSSERSKYRKRFFDRLGSRNSVVS